MENLHLQKALNNMTKHFSSNQFSKEAKKHGITPRQVQDGICAKFLHKNAIQSNTKRTWIKIVEFDTKSKRNIDYDIEYAINLLKSKGYKILKPITEFKEL